ncbi:MAG: J domain-containing protein [Alphaproteobacteria bacterium]|nr:J domain-containing protein [Alphaproteobacteria bacterium]MCL2505639.1 J domain-containing protein [Alphaproteobacteria bacterium]
MKKRTFRPKNTVNFDADAHNIYDSTPIKVRMCDHEGCLEKGEYPAPKDRDNLSERYYFCLEHVREYNKAWDFFKGMSPEQIEAYIKHAFVWERPTWGYRSVKSGNAAEQERMFKEARAKAFGDIFGDNSGVDDESRETTSKYYPPELCGALKELELCPPVTFSSVKKQYRLLVKKYHPDSASNENKDEEKFKRISAAFASLRKSYKGM